MNKKLKWVLIVVSTIAVIFLLSGSIKIVTQGILGITSISFSDNNQTFIFTYNNHAYISNIDFTNIKPITQHSTEKHNLNHVLSNDGSKILFIARNSVTSSFLYIMNSDGSDIQQVTYGKEGTKNIIEAIFSEDDKKIYFLNAGYYGHYSPIASSRPHDFDVYSINIDGSNLTKLTNIKEYELSGLSLDSKNKKLYFDSFERNDSKAILYLDLENYTLNIYNFEILETINHLNLSGIERFNFNESTKHYYFEELFKYSDPKVFPDGKNIMIHIEGYVSGDNSWLVLFNEKGEFVNQIVYINAEIVDPVLVDNSQAIMFITRPNNDFAKNELWIVNLNGSNLQKIDIKV